MATRFSSTLVSDITTDARFQAIATFVEDTLITTGGWLLSTETGDTAPGSLAHPTTTNSKKGFRVYKTNDGLTQIYMRIDYGSSAATSGNGFGMWLTIGTGSNGSGTISGVVLNGGGSTNPTVSTATEATAGTTTATNSYGSAGTGRVQLGLCINTTPGNAVVMSLERTKDATGADTSDGLLLTCTGGGSSSIWAVSAIASSVDVSKYMIVAGGTQPTFEFGLSYALTRVNPSETFGGDIGVGLVLHYKGVTVQPGLGMGVVNSSDVSAEGSFNATIYGSTRTYQHLNAVQPANPSSATAAAANASRRICIRYD